jgi:hypothetical protein
MRCTEVHLTFSSKKEINFFSVSKLLYILACLNEALRIYLLVVNSLPRVIPQGGAQVLGQYIPE